MSVYDLIDDADRSIAFAEDMADVEERIESLSDKYGIPSVLILETLTLHHINEVDSSSIA